MDGFVSLEVSPYLALRTDDTVAEARRLWAAVDRPNLMVKVPGTTAGGPAIRTLIADGQALLYSRPAVAIAPGLAVVATVLALNVLGEALRLRLDRGRRG